jgi:quercetin dioxygenase-like cupin family protein
MPRMLLGVMLMPLALTQTSVPQPPPGVTRTALVDNSSVVVARLKMEPGARETVHTHPFSAVVIQLTPGDVEMTLSGKTETRHHDAAQADFIPRNAPHAAANVGRAAFELITIGIKPDRKPGSAAPATAAPPGIERTILLDNDEARVTRVAFSPSAREPDHTHPYDLVLVALTNGTTELLLGSDRKKADHQAGFVWFLPRDVTHAVTSTSPGRIEFMSVGIK